MSFPKILKPLPLILIIILAATVNGHSQVGVRLSYQKHSADLGYLLKPTVLTELYYEGYTDYLFKYGASIGFTPLKTYLDTVPVGTIYIGDSTVLLPSWVVYKKMRQYSLGFNMEYKILDRNFSPVIGTDVYFHFIEYEEEYAETGNSPNYIDQLVVTMGILPRVGVCYNMTDDLILQAGIGKSLAIDYQWNRFLYWKIYCGVKYYFNN